MRPRFLVECSFALLVAAAAVWPARLLQAAWHVDLSNGGGGYWRTRIPVTVSRDSESPIVGVPVQLTVGNDQGQLPLVGASRRALRVCDDRGVEYLWSVSSASSPNGDGLSAGDVLTFAVDLSAEEASKLWYIYADNPDALPVEQFYGVTNGDFEEGGLWPDGWEVWKEDPSVVAEYLKDSGMGNSRCVHHCLTLNSRPEEQKAAHWEQHHVSVAPGFQYHLSGYVKLHNNHPQGSVAAGYYADLYNAAGTKLGETSKCWIGNACDWTQIDCYLNAPEDAAYMNIGTTFEASGEGWEAWHDNITVTPMSSPPLRIEVGTREHNELIPLLGDDAWNTSGNWVLRVDLRVRKFQPPSCPTSAPSMADGFTSGGALGDASPDTTDWVLADLREAVNRIRRVAPAGATPPFRMVVVDPVTLVTQTPVQVKDLVVFPAELKPGTEHRYYVYLSPEPEDPTAPGYGSLVDSNGHNLVANPSFEDDNLVWNPPDPNYCNANSVVQCGEVVEGGMHGNHCGRLINEDVDSSLSWWGWQQNSIKIVPSSTYLFAGYIKTENVRSCKGCKGVTLYGHFRNARDNTVVYFDAGHPLANTTNGWVLQTQVVTAPDDFCYADVHLTMYAFGTVWHDGILLARVEQAQQVAIERARDASPSEGVHVWSVNPMVKVLPDDGPTQPGSPAVTIFAARNEYEAFQLALWSKTELSSVTVTASALTLQNSPGSYWLAVDAFRIGTVPVDRPSGFYFANGSLWMRKPLHGDVVSDGWPGDWPDPLIPADPPGGAQAGSLTFDLPAGRTQGLWFHVQVPEDAPAGQYSGSVVVSAPNVNPISVPVNLTVWDFTLPETTSLQVIYDLHCLYHGNVPQGDDPLTYQPWYQFMSCYRVCPGAISPEPKFSYYKDDFGNVSVGMDADLFLVNARYCLGRRPEGLNMSAAFTPWFFYALWANELPRPLCFNQADGNCGVTIGFEDPEYKPAFQAAYQAFFHLVSENGWGDKFVHYLSDEPACYYSETTCSNVATIADYAREALPASTPIPIYASTWYHYRTLDDHLTHWGAGQFGLFPLDDMKARLEVGDKLWFTTDGQDVIDTPYLAWERLTPTYAFRCRWRMPWGEMRGVSGYEYWGLAWWTSDPWRRGAHDCLWSYDGLQASGIRYPNGDGYLCYPGEAINRLGPVPSIRLEAVREGIEDYEYYLMLEQLIGRYCSLVDSPRCQAAQAALQAARDLVIIPTDSCSRSTEIMPDPEAIYRVRQQVAQAILSLQCAVPVVSGITPNAGVQDSGNLPAHPPYGNAPPPGPVHVTITGANFTAGAVVRLTRAGKPDIVGTNVAVVDANTLTADFDLGGAAPGALDGSWDVVVTTCAAGTLPEAFTVAMCFAPQQDIDGDGDVDLADFAVLQTCFNGPNRPAPPASDPRKCRCSDAHPAPDGDGDVDLADFSALQACFNGPNRAPACAP